MLYNKIMKKKLIDICSREYDVEKYKGLLSRYFAHRGWHKDFPENSIPAFKKAVELGYGIELDVHLSKDRELVVFHDDELFRMTGEKDYVRFKTVDELQQLHLKDSEYTIPTLKEVFDLVAGKTPILLEVKTEANTKRICKKLVEDLKNYRGEVFIQSFNPFVLRYFYKHAPTYLRGQLSSYFRTSDLSLIKKNVIKKLRLKKFAHIDFISYNLKDLPNKYVMNCNVPVLAWTVRTKEDFEKAKQESNNLIVDNFDVVE